MFRMGLLSKLVDSTKFSNAFRKLCKSDPAAKAIIKKVSKDGMMEDKQLLSEIKIIFGELANVASGKFGGLYTKKEYDKMKGGK